MCTSGALYTTTIEAAAAAVVVVAKHRRISLLFRFASLRFGAVCVCTNAHTHSIGSTLYILYACSYKRRYTSHHADDVSHRNV